MVTLTLSQPSHTIKARYSSDCKCCGKPIIKGETDVCAVDNPRGNTRTWWVHVQCVGKEIDETQLDDDDQPKAKQKFGRRRKPKQHAIGDKMRSRFDSTCPQCSEPIAERAEIVYSTKGWVHAECFHAANNDHQHTQNGHSTNGQATAKAEPKASEPVQDPKADGSVAMDPAVFQTLIAELNKTAELLGDMKGLATRQTAELEELQTTLVQQDAERQMLAEKVTQLEHAQPKQIIIKSGEKTVKNDVTGVTNPIFERVLALAAARKNIFIPGPTGCGKTHLAEQVAEALGLPFGFVSCSVGMSEGHLNGRLLPVGEHGKFEYIVSEFVKCYENGGLFLIDEIDAADANVLLVINSALANGKMAVPNRPENPYAKRHPDFVCIAAANTWGHGADRMYVGRNQLDGATLDRFRIGQVAMDYDPQVEKAVCPNAELYETLTGYRDRARANRLERAISTRFMIDAYDMVTNHGWTMAEIEQALFADWRADEIAKVKGSI